ncbi:hypothetical protein RRG08_061010 [Elysia crispata]|uniref:Uncharacterized protein n=1 Tax=Elysia crispata TaxID=231223 RepID=A0AAE1E5J3_9GAST|nr:hypothetical protein RRG08_061010 [Elysia crispata]
MNDQWRTLDSTSKHIAVTPELGTDPSLTCTGQSGKGVWVGIKNITFKRAQETLLSTLDQRAQPDRYFCYNPPKNRGRSSRYHRSSLTGQDLAGERESDSGVSQRQDSPTSFSDSRPTWLVSHLTTCSVPRTDCGFSPEVQGVYANTLISRRCDLLRFGEAFRRTSGRLARSAVLLTTQETVRVDGKNPSVDTQNRSGKQLEESRDFQAIIAWLGGRTRDSLELWRVHVQHRSNLQLPVTCDNDTILSSSRVFFSSDLHSIARLLFHANEAVIDMFAWLKRVSGFDLEQTRALQQYKLAGRTSHAVFANHTMLGIIFSSLCVVNISLALLQQGSLTATSPHPNFPSRDIPYNNFSAATCIEITTYENQYAQQSTRRPKSRARTEAITLYRVGGHGDLPCCAWASRYNGDQRPLTGSTRRLQPSSKSLVMTVCKLMGFRKNRNKEARLLRQLTFIMYLQNYKDLSYRTDHRAINRKESQSFMFISEQSAQFKRQPSTIVNSLCIKLRLNSKMKAT